MRNSTFYIATFLSTIILFSFSCTPAKEDPRFKEKYIVLPAARFVPQQSTPVRYPSCPTADYPLFCGENQGCCGEGFPFGCPSQSRCYASQPDAECPGAWVECAPPDVLITGIAPHEATLRPGQSMEASVSFRHWGAAALQKLIVQVSGIDGEFEQDLSADEIAAGRVVTTIRIVTEKPDLSTCLQECSRTGACGPCFVSTKLPFWPVYFRLADESGGATGTILEQLSLDYEASAAGGECTDTSRCCTTQDCGGISCIVDAITVPDSCGQCPAGTTQVGIDVHYHLLQCGCDACSE